MCKENKIIYYDPGETFLIHILKFFCVCNDQIKI